MTSGVMTYEQHIKSQDDRFRRSSNTETITSTMPVVSVLVLLMGRIYDVRIWDYYLNNLRRCSVCITDGRNLWNMLLRCPRVT
jgi:hypothetical protein